ncbi:PQQ-dependent sugar dehydrogenase [Aestuariivirga litoralis]|uniref:PQQ-dependent sugar dehydrogenase n=1 Tax=Aestuariivirga litoralis TaxID=2650924 RepID=A0A2W2ASQ4_9HYPH|nr:PQQ-dependent sugar dehydrogenase [Aestuariivirga litoralis]PZF75550.1 PQQ-dependent sugar dehydrogenase [Aestuariivirga litoralis]
MIDRRSLLASLLAVPLAPLAARASSNVTLETVAEGLDHPWSFAFLPEGPILVTERKGNLRTIASDGKLSEPISGLPEVAAGGQGGLLDIALHPNFATTRLVFLSFAEPREEGKNGTSVMRGRLSEDLRSLSDVKVIFREQPAYKGGAHFGSRLAFDRTGALFVTTGDRLNLRPLVQQTDNHIGKVIRITEDGGIPPDNPKVAGWLPEIWSIGHRNLQGATIHPETGRLWTTEHGAKGGDELNHPEAGRNYGWPVITYSREYSGEPIGEGLTETPGMEQPVHVWTPSIGPSGMVFYTGDRYSNWKGDLFVGALALKHVARLKLDGDKVIEEEKLFDGEARFRDVRQGPDGFFYVLTDEAAPKGRVMRVVAG